MGLLPALFNKHSHFPRMNYHLRFNGYHLRHHCHPSVFRNQTYIETLMMIDSLDMKEIDRRLIVDSCETTNEKNIIVTHGTDTMTETANKLGEKNLQKTIVLTGAMIPYKFGTSDGLFNIASALAYVQTLSSGVYVAMNGRVFSHDNVIKNKETGVFEEIK